MKKIKFLFSILLVLITFQYSWSDADPWTKENEKYAQEYLEKLRQEKPELFRQGDLLSKKFITAQFAEKYGNTGDSKGWLQYNFEYHFSTGWCIAKVFILNNKHDEQAVKYEIYRTSKSVNDYKFEFSGDEKIVDKYSNKCFEKKYEDGEVRYADISDELDTKRGKLRVIAKQYEDKGAFGMHDTLVLNYEEIFSCGGNIRLYGVYNINNKPHILIGENCGGTGCRFDDLSILILSDSKEVKVVRSDDFYSEDNSIKAKLKSNKLIINLGLFKGKKKTAIYSNNELKIIYKKRPFKSLTAKQCADLYEIARGCTTLTEIKEFSCEEEAINFSGKANSDTWALRYISNEPGFSQKLFDEECFNACKTGQLPEYNEFSKRLCDHKVK